jgi:DNA-binding phage protein
MAMPDTPVTRRSVKFDPKQRAEHDAIRDQVAADMPRLQRKAAVAKARLETSTQAVEQLKAARVAAGISLEEVASISGLTKEQLEMLESAAHPDPSLETLARIAHAIGVKLHILVAAA